jgi:hypothetical protein
MNITTNRWKRKLVCVALGVCLFHRLALAGDATAFDLIKEANRYVGEDAKDKVVQIRSEKSVASLSPDIWWVVFYDPDATFKATEVKFAAGKKMEVKRPFRVLEYVKAEKVFDKAKLKVDSDKAIKIATSEELLKRLTLRSTQLWLDSNLKSDLSVTGPVWRVRLWAEKLNRSGNSVDIGEVFVSAEDGKVVKTDLHIGRVD